MATSYAEKERERAPRANRGSGVGVKQGFSAFLRGPAGKVVAIVLLLLGVAAIVYSFKSNFGASEASSLSRQRMFVCSETLKPFKHEISEGEAFPVVSPFSGKNTGYPAEECWWTKDGTIKSEPTYVLLNVSVHKPGPTFCPDCGRLVVGHNPHPQPGDHPPPTREQYQGSSLPPPR